MSRRCGELTGRILAENGCRVSDAADGYRARILCDQLQGQKPADRNRLPAGVRAALS